MLLRPLPVEKPRELVLLSAPGPNSGGFHGDDTHRLWSAPAYRELRDRNGVFSALFARKPANANLGYRGSTEAIAVEIVSGNYFGVLGIRPAAGRLIAPADDGAKNQHPVVTLAYGYWMKRFAADASIIGQTVRLNSTLMTVTGVAPRGFFGLDVGSSPDVYVPLAMNGAVNPMRDTDEDRTQHSIHLLGRLKPGTTLANAQSLLQTVYGPILNRDLAAMTGPVTQNFRERFLKKQIVLQEAYGGVPTFSDDAAAPLTLLMGMVGLVLLIACANVANLLIARGVGRQREIAIRLALGAARGDVMRQLMVESLALSMLGAAAGLFLAVWTSSLLVHVLPTDGTAHSLDGALDARAVLFSSGLALASGLVSGLLPAIQSTRPDVYPTLKNQAGSVMGGFGQMRSRQALVVAQVALSLLLLAGAGLFTRSLAHLKNVDPGFNTGRMAIFDVDAARNGYSHELVCQTYEDMQSRLAALPGVTAAALAMKIPLTGDESTSGVEVPGYTPKPEDDSNLNFDRVSPGFFAAMEIPLVAGRDFTARDRMGAPKVAVVNEAFVKRFFGTENPVGRRIGVDKHDVYDVEIIGVVKNARFSQLRDNPAGYVFIPYAQYERLNKISAIVRTAGAPQALMPSMRREVANLDSNLAIADMRTMEEQVERSLFAERLISTLCATFLALATLLASIGLDGVTAFSVARRTREIGIRVALGADRASVYTIVLKEVAWMAVGGIVVGLPLAIGLSRYIASQLYGIGATDT